MTESISVNIEFPSISAELQEMARIDQAMRKDSIADPAKWDAEVDRSNTARLKVIIDEIGWPTISKVGSEASTAAWLLAQHADSDRPFQERALLMMKECSVIEVAPWNIAFLEDRVLMWKGMPQLYGTQCSYQDGVVKPLPILDEQHVDERRAAAGLPPLAEYLAEFPK